MQRYPHLSPRSAVAKAETLHRLSTLHESAWRSEVDARVHAKLLNIGDSGQLHSHNPKLHPSLAFQPSPHAIQPPAPLHAGLTSLTSDGISDGHTSSTPQATPPSPHASPPPMQPNALPSSLPAEASPPPGQSNSGVDTSSSALWPKPPPPRVPSPRAEALATSAPAAPPPIAAAKRASLQKAFAVFDRDGSGSISVEGQLPAPVQAHTYRPLD